MSTKQTDPNGDLRWMADKVIQMPLAGLKPYAKNNRKHSAKSTAKLSTAIKQFGFVIPIVIDAQNVIIAGHGRVEAAKAMGLAVVPVVVADHLSQEEARALRIADNRLAELSEWDDEALRIEFSELMDLSLDGHLDFDLDITGFATPEIDILIQGAESETEVPPETVEEPDVASLTVTRPGDLWVLGGHRLLCGDALVKEYHARVLGGDTAQMVFTDPPYNVPVQGHVRSGNGGEGHREFAMASGEMTAAEFRAFLTKMFARLFAALPKGGLAFVCMDWRHIEELIATGKAAGFELLNLCVWNKTNGGMGSLYRSKHELVAIFKCSGAPHINNVELGKHGRNRTNVWDYAGVNSFGAAREADLADHPTVKPTALVADAILDVTHRGDIVLDPFGGSGATLLGAEKTGRKARLIELDPLYVDVAIRRWEALTGQSAVLEATGETWAERKAAREADATGEEQADG